MMSLKKRIFYIESNEDGTIGGSHYCLLEIVKRIDREKYIPIVYFYQNNSLVNEFKKHCEVIIKDIDNGLDIKKSYTAIYTFFSANIVSLKLLLLAQRSYNFIFCHLPYYGRVLYLLRKHKVDLIHMNNMPVLTHWLVGAKLSGKLCISHLRGNWEPTKLHILLSKHYDCLISISQSVLDYVSKNGLDTSNIVKIYDGIDTKSVLASKTRNRSDVRRELSLSQDDFVVAVIGNIKRWKGQHVAIQAVQALCNQGKNIKCLIVGDISLMKDDRDYFDYMKQYVKENNLAKNITFTGYRNDIPDIVSSVDVIMLTSTDPEPLGRVVFEGMLFEKPVLATAHGGPAEIIHDGVTGYLTPPNDVKMLSEKISFILSNPEIAAQTGARARREVENNYDISVNVRSIQELYSQYL